MSDWGMSGEMTRLGESNLVSANSWPAGVPRSGSNRIAPQIEIRRRSS